MNEEKTFNIDGVEYAVGDDVSYADLHWSSDWNGDEVGYDDIPVVGLYSFKGTEIYVYLNTEDGTILEIWDAEEEDE